MKLLRDVFFVFDFIHDWYKTQEMCGFLVYCPYRYQTQRMSDETVDDCLAALKFIPDWFVTSKMLEKSDKPLHANNDMFFYNEDSD